MASTFKIFQGTNRQYYFRLVAANGETILQSEGYIQRDGCLNGIKSVKTNAPYEYRYDRRTSVDQRPYFVLKAGNGEVIGTSQMYSSVAARDKGILAVMAAAPDARIVD